MPGTPSRVLYASQNAILFPTTGDVVFDNYYPTGGSIPSGKFLYKVSGTVTGVGFTGIQVSLSSGAGGGGSGYYPATGALGQTGVCYALALNSVSLDVTNPIENVLVFGKLGAAARLQKEPSKTKISLKSYLTTGIPTGFIGLQEFNAAALNTLKSGVLAGTYSKIVVDPNGFTGYGVLSSIGIEASTNNFVTLDLGFEGLGTPRLNPVPTGISNSNYAGSLPLITSLTPITSNYVAAGVASNDAVFTGDPNALITSAGSCVTSAKFSFDFPTDTIMCLGSAITGTLQEIAAGNVIVGKPPFKASIVVEGTAASACDAVDFGTVLVKLDTPRLMSQTVNQAVGNVGQTYNFTVEDLDATFSASTLTGVSVT